MASGASLVKNSSRKCTVLWLAYPWGLPQTWCWGGLPKQAGPGGVHHDTDSRVCQSGQHYWGNISQSFTAELGLPFHSFVFGRGWEWRWLFACFLIFLKGYYKSESRES